MFALASLVALTIAKSGPNLVPERASGAPDYFCTWNIQGYACSYTGVPPTRALMRESSLFGRGALEGWLDFYPSVRKDLLFVMDDSWDVPVDNDERALGRLQLDEGKFPRFRGRPEQRMARLTKAVKAKGWRGLGGWVCAQECPLLPQKPLKAYWADRLRELAKGGVTYLKVDWGRHAEDLEWRRMLAELRAKNCPNTIIESALTPESIRFADTYRTYDVETVISAPSTLDRVAALMTSPAAKGSSTILNCEDEMYIGATLGCSYGVMRHPLAGPLPNGRQDFVFPPTCRDLKRRMEEVVRSVRWHRIAPPFAIGKADFVRSPQEATDRWTLEKDETYRDRAVGSVVTASAPAIMARGMRLPVVACDEPEPPFVAATRYPNGCLAVGTIGRALGRTYRTPLADVRVEGASPGRPIGVFGHYRSLSIRFDGRKKPKAVRAQDLAGGRSENVVDQIRIEGDVLTLPGALIERIGLAAGRRGDLSDPGLVLVVEG